MTETATDGKKIRVKQVIPLNEAGVETVLHDFQISASDSQGNITMIDMEFIDPAVKTMVEYKLQPGSWRVTPKDGMQKLDLPEEPYVETDAARWMLKHFNTFFSKVEVYTRKGRVPVRKLLLGSEPGMGKSACIRHFLRQKKAEEGTCILRCDTSEISWETMTQMFMKAKPDDVKRVILVVEDIGGTALDERRHRVDSDLLNFLSGNSDVFKVPTLVVGTTNYLNEIGAIINDRPGRFDVVKQLDPPSDADTITIVEFLIGRAMTDAEKKALLGKKFTPAYCEEAITRAELHEITIEEAVSELIEQRKRSQGRTHGSNRTAVGFGDFDD